jgi:hypothetical protein
MKDSGEPEQPSREIATQLPAKESYKMMWVMTMEAKPHRFEDVWTVIN